MKSMDTCISLSMFGNSLNSFFVYVWVRKTLSLYKSDFGLA